MAAQHREEALKAMDRATRTTFKYQALVQWAADAIQQMTEQTPAAEKRNPYASRSDVRSLAAGGSERTSTKEGYTSLDRTTSGRNHASKLSQRERILC